MHPRHLSKELQKKSSYEHCHITQVNYIDYRETILYFENTAIIIENNIMGEHNSIEERYY